MVLYYMFHYDYTYFLFVYDVYCHHIISNIVIIYIVHIITVISLASVPFKGGIFYLSKLIGGQLIKFN